MSATWKAFPTEFAGMRAPSTAPIYSEATFVIAIQALFSTQMNICPDAKVFTILLIPVADYWELNPCVDVRCWWMWVGLLWSEPSELWQHGHTLQLPVREGILFRRLHLRERLLGFVCLFRDRIFHVSLVYLFSALSVVTHFRFFAPSGKSVIFCTIWWLGAAKTTNFNNRESNLWPPASKSCSNSLCQRYAVCRLHNSIFRKLSFLI